MVINIFGTVRAQGTTVYLVGLRVQVASQPGRERTAVTDQNGRFTIPYDPEGVAVLVLRVFDASAAVVFERALRVDHKEAVNVDIELRPGTPSGPLVSTPASGRWNAEIDGYLERHPVALGSLRSSATPRLEIEASPRSVDLSSVAKGTNVSTTITIRNLGSAASHSAYVQLYEWTPHIEAGHRFFWIGAHPLKACRLLEYRVVTLQSGQARDVLFEFRRDGDVQIVVAVCHDPLLDPRGFDKLLSWFSLKRVAPALRETYFRHLEIVGITSP